MKIILKLFAAGLLFLAIALPAVFLLARIMGGRITAGAVVAFSATVAFSFVAARAGAWLWRSDPLWTEEAKIADVITAFAAIALIAPVPDLEKITTGVVETSVQLGAIAVIVGVYFVTRWLVRSCVRRPVDMARGNTGA